MAPVLHNLLRPSKSHFCDHTANHDVYNHTADHDVCDHTVDHGVCLTVQQIAMYHTADHDVV